ncbi:ATP-binding protein [Sporolactobacillus kofuensis]|uniref:histidine kinase n=1 Tax=Sporolactobacillus kofuensis TaxID=269672 RepID=A0ABW1WD02_9BACL|nr:HAMP domain-containing sensor histidine kinase [Sporolactobacillus kofuensis]MCO7175431.1 HAMP domain-containing histidine kinase [Sporolactobacillus kofuensis]
MTRKLVLHFMIIILLTLALSETVLFWAVRHYFYDRVENTLQVHAQDSNSLYKKFNSKLVIHRWSNPLNEVMDSFKFSGTTLEIYDASGNMVDSSTNVIDPSKIELNASLFYNNEFAQVERLASTGEKVMAVYFPVHVRGKVYILRYLSSLIPVDHELRIILLASLLCGGAVALLVFVVSLKLAQSIATPMKQMIDVSSKMASGNFTIRMHEDYQDELGDLAKTLNSMADEIQKNERLQNTFISSISHDLLTPLTGIKGWSETMLMDEATTIDEFREGLTVISKESNRLTQLVGDLLDLSKLKQNTLTIHRERIRIDEVLKRSIRSIQMKAAAKNCRVVIQHDKKVVVDADANRMQQVLINLLANAIKFADAGTQIIASIDEDQTSIRISIKDWGVVIEQNEIPKLTDPFYQTKSNGRGSGLGLAISKNIIDLHGGTLSITSDLKSGTKVVITLPKAE